ncbi:ion transporter [Vibrio sp. UCD-FRSSP16_10]|uniref:ion transporter n=1 Tax=unclassified Vibrio TaxID=2614977 RepID=UPI00080112B1|nr:MULTISPECIES: ion transporter [unclassified Vibrio]OBT13062.1 ion transporter [Vibrio sp. UCD-FRSSP16_30]OBT19271.1 ion transporter [Vibrio sp. UCD-FRSSP16_10]
MQPSEQRLKHKLYVIIFRTDTPLGRGFDIALILSILSSLLVLIMGSVESVSDKWSMHLNYLEVFFTALFTIEYLLRLYCSPKPWAYAKSFYGFVDLVAILPFYLALLIPNAHFLGVVRLLRIMRIFRILKLVQYIQDSNVIMRSLWNSRRKIFIFFSMVAILVTIFGALLYIIEGPENGFTSIPTSIYWAIVTITTVGYGDISPVTTLGRAIASLTMLLGYSILAVPTGIITAEISQEVKQQKKVYQDHRNLVMCPNCMKNDHEPDAFHCKHCGSELPAHEERVVKITNATSDYD